MKATVREEDGNVTEVNINSADVSVLIRQDTRSKSTRVFMYNPDYSVRSNNKAPMFIECEHQFVTLPAKETQSV